MTLLRDNYWAAALKVTMRIALLAATLVSFVSVAAVRRSVV
jgi:hypothetical protein